MNKTKKWWKNLKEALRNVYSKPSYAIISVVFFLLLVSFNLLISNYKLLLSDFSLFFPSVLFNVLSVKVRVFWMLFVGCCDDN